MENNDKPVSKSHLEALAKVYDLPESELMPYWLGEKVLHILEGINKVLRQYNWL